MMSASKSFGLVRNAKLVADFMSYEHEQDHEVDPTCMKGYHYLVSSKEKGKVKVNPPLYQKRLDIEDKQVITTHKIWQCGGRLLSSAGDPDGQLKDVCLSFALFKLLSRRFGEYPLYECSGPARTKTWNFVRHGLLESDPERAFRVIEVELAFLYDLFYTKYPAIFTASGAFYRVFTIVGVLVSCWCTARNLSHYHSSDAHFSAPTVRIGGVNIDVLVTGIVMAAIVLVEVVQLVYIIYSDWTKVILLCKYVQHPSWQQNKFREKMIEIVCHSQLSEFWERKLGQYSFLQSFDHDPFMYKQTKNKNRASDYMDIPRRGQKRSDRIQLPVEVKKAVIHSLKSNGRRLTNGVSSLQKNGVENELSWACRFDKQVHVIMIWHIATTLCEIKANQQRGSGEHFIVATSLSKYCAYLVTFFPRFLPDHPYDTEFIVDEAVSESRDLLKGCKSLTSKYEKMMILGQGNSREKIIEGGAVLGRQLMEGITDQDLRWKIWADFWAEMMLFVAPSDDVTAHAENLTVGEEFITHLWALLSHAGILKRDSTVQGA